MDSDWSDRAIPVRATAPSVIARYPPKACHTFESSRARLSIFRAGQLDVLLVRPGVQILAAPGGGHEVGKSGVQANGAANYIRDGSRRILNRFTIFAGYTFAREGEIRP